MAHQQELDRESIRKAVRAQYSAVAERGASCCGPAADDACCDPAARLYTPEELMMVTQEAASASAGCGNPIGLADAKPGETVLDLGSGGGIDCFFAAKTVGPGGRVIGIDMTDRMLELATQNATKLGATNVEFKKGHIEEIPQPDSTVDLVISNCVIALSDDKDAVFREIFRILKPGGRLVISDMVTNEELPEDVRRSAAEWVTCVGGADLKDRYLQRIERAGFERREVVEDVPVSERDDGQPWRSHVRSITVKAFKPG